MRRLLFERTCFHPWYRAQVAEKRGYLGGLHTGNHQILPVLAGS